MRDYTLHIEMLILGICLIIVGHSAVSYVQTIIDKSNTEPSIIIIVWFVSFFIVFLKLSGFSIFFFGLFLLVKDWIAIKKGNKP